MSRMRSSSRPRSARRIDDARRAPRRAGARVPTAIGAQGPDLAFDRRAQGDQPRVDDGLGAGRFQQRAHRQPAGRHDDDEADAVLSTRRCCAQSCFASFAPALTAGWASVSGSACGWNASLSTAMRPTASRPASGEAVSGSRLADVSISIGQPIRRRSAWLRRRVRHRARAISKSGSCPAPTQNLTIHAAFGA